MSHDTRPKHPRAKAVLMTGAAVMLALVLAQCRPVADNVLGLRFGATSATSTTACLTRCANIWADSAAVEGTLHGQIISNCNGDTICIALENARFQPVVDRIVAGRMACQNDCHHQGGGTAGR